MKQQIKNTRYGRRCKQRLSSVVQYIYIITNKQAGALKHSSKLFWRLTAIILFVALTSLELSAAIMPIIINKMDKLLYKQLIRFEILIPKNDDPRYDELLSELEQEFSQKFGGCSTDPNIFGKYMSEQGKLISDNNRRLYVDLPKQRFFNKSKMEKISTEIHDRCMKSLPEESFHITFSYVYVLQKKRSILHNQKTRFAKKRIY